MKMSLFFKPQIVRVEVSVYKNFQVVLFKEIQYGGESGVELYQYHLREYNFFGTIDNTIHYEEALIKYEDWGKRYYEYIISKRLISETEFRALKDIENDLTNNYHHSKYWILKEESAYERTAYQSLNSREIEIKEPIKRRELALYKISDKDDFDYKNHINQFINFYDWVARDWKVHKLRIDKNIYDKYKEQLGLTGEDRVIVDKIIFK